MTDRDGARLPEAAEAALAAWPAPERDEAAWEQLADGVTRRLEAGPERTADELLAPPLPAGRDEVEAEKKPRRPQPAAGSEPSLTDIARARVAHADDGKEAAEIAKESLTLLKEERHAGAMATSVAAAAASRDHESDAAPERVVDLEAARARREAAEQAVQAARASESRTARLAAVALVAVGIAAGAALWIRGRSEAPATQVIVITSTEPAAAVAVAPAPKPGSVPADEPAGRAPGSPATGEDPARQKVAAGRAGAPVQPEAVSLAESPAGQAAPKPAPEDEEQLEPALGLGTPREEPSSGDVSAALAPVLGRARRCLVGQDSPSTATVVVGSSGTVQSVAVSGPAAGTSAEGCLRAALGAMRFKPFAQPTFTIRGITIRP